MWAWNWWIRMGEPPACLFVVSSVLPRPTSFCVGPFRVKREDKSQYQNHLCSKGFSLSFFILFKKPSQVTHLCKIASHLSFLSLITLLWLPSFISISGGIECLLLLSPDYLIFDNDLLSSIEKLPSLYVDCFLLSSTPAKILQLLLCKLN